MRKMRILSLLVCVIALVSLCCLCATAETAPADVYIATTGVDTNAGTEAAPVLSLNKALELVQNGGTVHILDSYTAPSDFKWENHNKDVTITGGTLDFTQAGKSQKVDGQNHPFYYQGDAVTFDNTKLIFADNAYYFANGFRLQINENVTVTGANLQLYGGGANGYSVSSTDVTLLGGSYSQIFGGGYKSNVSGNVYLYVGNINAGYKVSHNGTTRLYGGSDAGKVYGDIDLTIAGANIDRIYGGNKESGAASASDITLQMTGGNAYSLYGGHYYASGVQTGNISLTISGGTLNQVFGANNNSGHRGNVNVNLVGGTITRRFLGGCYNEYDTGYATDYHVEGNICVYIHEGMTFNWKSEGLTDDLGLYARSRYNKQLTNEHTYIYYMGQVAEEKHEDHLGAQNTMMSIAMGSVTAADSISVYETDVMTTPVEKWNVVLGDDIGASFAINIPEAIAKVSNVHVTVNGRTKTYDLSKQSPNAEGLYVVSARVEAAQMTEPMVLQLVVNGVECKPFSVTIRDYAEFILKGDYAEKTKELLKHTLNYGAAAQNYFDINTENAANEGYEIEYTAQFPAEYPQTVKNGQIDGIAYYGASLLIKEKITLRYYFVADSLEGVTFTANGAVCKTGQKNGMFYVDVPGINPHQYSESVLLCAVKGEQRLEVSYSPLYYMVRMSQTTDSEPLKKLLSAMYGYHEAAVIYVGNSSATVSVSDAANGTVRTDKTSYLPGQVVTLTVTPDAGYDLRSLTVKKNGAEVDLGQLSVLGGNYTFVAQTGNYTVEATFAPRTFEYSPYWDMTQQYDGVITLLKGASEARTARTTLNSHRQIEVTVRDHEKGTFKTEFHFVFGEGKEFQIRLDNETGAYRIQKMGTAFISGWSTLHALTEEEVAALKSASGIKFRVALVGTKAIAYLNSVKVGEVDLSGKITTEETAEIRVVLYGNKDVENISIPFTMTSAPAVFRDTEHWDLTTQEEGIVTILKGYEKGRTLVTQANTYRDIAVTVKDYQKGTFKAEYHFVFGEGREFQIRLHNENTGGEYRVQKMATTLSSGWKNVYTLNAGEVEQLKSESGIAFRVAIVDTWAYAYINGTLVGQVDLTTAISATESAQIKLIVYGNNGVENITVPFALSSDPAHADITVAEGITKGTINTNKTVYAVGETITLTATPDEGYYLKSLAVKKEGQTVDIGAIDLNGGTYTFTAEEGSYTVEAVFAKKIFQDSANWDLTKQDEGKLTIPAKGSSSMGVTTTDALYREASVTVRDFTQYADAAAAGDFQMQIRFIFENGRQYQIRVHNTVKAGQYEVQSMGDTNGVCITGWKWHKNFSSAQSQKMQSEGVTFRVALEGTNAVIYVDGTKFFTYNLTSASQFAGAGVDTNSKAQVRFVMYGNNGQKNVEIPFTLG